MRIDHIVIHVDNDEQKMQALKETANAQGYPFDPSQGKRSGEIATSNIYIGDEYVEIVRILKPNVQSWMPLWTRAYDGGQRGAFCIFLEVEDVERTAVAIKKAGIRARGPAVLSYPFLGIFKRESPYLIYYLPYFPDTNLQLALMQYKNLSQRDSFMAGMQPNSDQNGINGIRRVEVALPNLDESMETIQKVFSDLHLENGEWATQLDKTRLLFGHSPDDAAHLRIFSITSQRTYVGKKFQVDNVEFNTTGG